VFAKTLETAELIKLASNTFRDLNFAYANLLALIANEHNVNVHELINLANFRYERSQIDFPGLVGGPCLEKDAYILAQSCSGAEAKMILEGRKLNEDMISRAVQFVVSHDDCKSATLLLCGAAFKGRPVTSDTRGSFIFPLIEALGIAGIGNDQIHVLDPIVSSVAPGITVLNSFDQLSAHYDFMIQLTNHEIFDVPRFNQFSENCVSHVVSFWPRVISGDDISGSLYLGGFRHPAIGEPVR